VSDRDYDSPEAEDSPAEPPDRPKNIKAAVAAMLGFFGLIALLVGAELIRRII